MIHVLLYVGPCCVFLYDTYNHGFNDRDHINLTLDIYESHAVTSNNNFGYCLSSLQNIRICVNSSNP